MFIGAHPDDADIEFGGTAIKLIDSSHKVIFVSMTDGSKGHHIYSDEELKNIRATETKSVAEFLGIEYLILNNKDTELIADLSNRKQLIRLIREHSIDIIVTHRTNDYHPDHRAVAQLVQDASFLLTVPKVLPDVNRLERMPLILFHQDTFSFPRDFKVDFLVDITSVINKKMENLSLHKSQVFEWLPFIDGYEVPEDRKEKMDMLKREWGNTGNVLRFLNMAKKTYPSIEFIEAFEISEYGRKITKEEIVEIFDTELVYI
jgi:LmbE family N-acetylglucosaminyl deacetylase